MNKFTDIRDEDILHLLGQDDTAAFRELYNRYWDKMYSAAYKRIKDSAAAEEIVQDLFTDIWYRRRMLPAVISIRIYLYTAVHYKAINHIRKQIRRDSFEKHANLYHLDFDNSTEDYVIVNDLNARLQLEVNLLPLKCREVYTLSRNEYKTNREIAQSLGISEKAVEKHITKALKRLKTSLNILSLLF
jgi:RNA polymerase sigma-70 factor (family 1)